VNRTLTFVSRYYDGLIPEAEPSERFWNDVTEREKEVEEHLEHAELRDAFRAIFGISDIANKRFQEEEPWKSRTDNPQRAASLMRDLCYVLKDLAIMIHPYMPRAAEQLAGFLGLKVGDGGLSWKDLGLGLMLKYVRQPDILFRKLEDDKIAALRERLFSSQKERGQRMEEEQMEPKEIRNQQPLDNGASQREAIPQSPQESPEVRFNVR